MITGKINRQRSLSGAMFSAGKESCKEKVPFQTQTSSIPRAPNTGVSSYKYGLSVSTDTLVGAEKNFWSTTMTMKQTVDL